MEKLLFVLALFSFVASSISIAYQPNVLDWFLALANIFLLFFWAIQLSQKEPKSYEWLCAYNFKNGSGRIFITSETNKLTKSLVQDIEKFIENQNDFDKCHVVNLQLMDE